MPNTMTSRQIEHLLADVWLFDHRGRAVEASFSFDEPERVLPVGLRGKHATEIEWDAFSDLIHADEQGRTWPTARRSRGAWAESSTTLRHMEFGGSIMIDSPARFCARLPTAYA
jgi:hypothetical protein